MAISKVVYKSSSSATPVVWMDVTSVTATAADVASGKWFINAAGVLEQGTLSTSVPCTGLTLSQSSVTITDMSAYTLTATPTPNNTTDTVSWASSNTNIATVSGGVVTPLRGGSVTITATCGEQTASCSFTIRQYLTANMTYYYYFGKSTSADGDTLNVEGGTSTTTYGCSIITTGSGRYTRDANNYLSGGHAYPIMLPAGCTSIAITVPYQNIKVTVEWCNSTQGSGYGDSYIRLLSHEGSPWASAISNGDRTIPVPDVSGIDCFYVNAYRSSANGNLSQEILDEITVEALYT